MVALFRDHYYVFLVLVNRNILLSISESFVSNKTLVKYINRLRYHCFQMTVIHFMYNLSSNSNAISKFFNEIYNSWLLRLWNSHWVASLCQCNQQCACWLTSSRLSLVMSSFVFRKYTGRVSVILVLSWTLYLKKHHQLNTRASILA